VAEAVLRIFSDIHYGDRLSRVRALEQLRPLCEGIDQLVLNGDTLDTRDGPNPGHTAQCRAEVAGFVARAGVPVTFLTGNHDPDFSTQHQLDLADGEVFVIHGDVLFESIVPWGHDAEPIRRKVRAELAALPAGAEHRLEERVAAFRRVAASLQQRHQAERDPIKYAYRFLTDTVWPPPSALNMLRAWRDLPRLAGALAAEHRPRARFAIVGHTHRPGVWPTAAGVTVINTGSFSPPFGGMVADLAGGRLTVRRIEARRGAFHPGRTVAEFALGRAQTAARPHAA
jgi:predicted phosphodiesterase